MSTRPSFFGLEMHLLDLYKTIAEFRPTSVVIDPLTSLPPAAMVGFRPAQPLSGALLSRGKIPRLLQVTTECERA